MLLAAGCQPGEIAAITFTEAAASELAKRIHAVVHDLLNNKVPPEMTCALPTGLDERQHKALTAAAQKLDELTSTTIHSFCQSIIIDHGVAAGLDPGSRIADEGAAELMFEDAFSSWLVGALSSNDPVDEAVVTFVQNPLEKPVDTLRKLANLWKDHRSARPAQADITSRPDVDLINAISAFGRWVDRHPYDLPTNSLVEQFEELRKHYFEALQGVPDFSRLWRLSMPPRIFAMLQNSFELRSYSAVETWASTRRNDQEILRAEAAALYQDIVDAFSETLGHIAGLMVMRLSQSLRKVLENYAEAKRQAAIMDFDDLLFHARDLVMTDEDIRRTVGERYRRILVDEFQDTDLVQTEILFSICAHEKTTDWRTCHLRPGSLFIVGDPKQAIYRFRRADIEAYRMAREVILAQPNGILIPITANFRSQRPIIDYVNATFATVFDGSAQPSHVPLSPTLDQPSNGAQCVAKLTINGRGQGQLRQNEAERVANLCQRLIGRFLVRRKAGALEPARPSDIALLAPSYTELWRYELALEALRVPVTSQASKALMQRQETQDVLALLRTLADPDDKLAFGALMRGPLIGLSDQTLLDITAELDDAGYKWGFNIRTPPINVSNPYARSVLEVLQHLQRRVANMPPSQLLAEALDGLGARLIIAARHRSRYAHALANVDALVEMAKRYATAGLDAFVHGLQDKWERSEPVHEGRGDTADDSVQIITMHSAKGLEWPVVVPIGTATKLRSPGRFVHRRDDNTLHWLIGGVTAPGLRLARQEEERQDYLEKERMWYVASTRARDLLIVPEFIAGDPKSWSKVIDRTPHPLPEVEFSSLIAEIKPSMGSFENAQTAAVFAEQQRLVQASSPVIKWSQPSVHDSDRTVAVLDTPQELETIPLWVLPAGAGRIRGSVLHKLIEETLTGELSIDLDEMTARSRDLLEQFLVKETKPANDLPDPEEMATTVWNTFKISDVEALLPFMTGEVPVWRRQDTDYLAGRADALVLVGDLIAGVIDWKSDVDPTREQTAQYIGQVESYLQATGAIAGAVVFMSARRIVWVGNRDELLQMCGLNFIRV